MNTRGDGHIWKVSRSSKPRQPALPGPLNGPETYPWKRGISVRWRYYITADPAVCPGRTCIVGARLLVTIVLDPLTVGSAPDEIMESCPSDSGDVIEVTLCYAAELVKELNE